MAETDWTDLVNSVPVGSLRRGVTSLVTPPAGGGLFTHVWNSATSGVTGAHGRYYNAVNFAPMASGCRITGALKRLPSGGPENFAPMLFCGLQGNDVNDEGYLIGLQDDDPSAIVIVKGVLANGLPEGDASDPATEPKILRKSTDSVAVDEWVHMRVDMIVNGTGDVILKIFRNDLDTNDVDAPVWDAIPGMADFVDDFAGIATGAVPFTSGYAGFAFFMNNVTRRGAVDHVTIARQL